ncbi:MAG: HAD-IA family hydrolase [Candidatus Dormibacteria bacterium]
MLEAVIFDLDGTLVDSERDGHRVAFNRAFEDFGLADRWDPEYYGELLQTTGGLRRIDQHLAASGMPEAERHELVPRLHARKIEVFREMAASGLIQARPGLRRFLDDLAGDGLRLAVATTGTKDAVVPLIRGLFGDSLFEAVITRDEAPLLKPDPMAYVIAQNALGIAPDEGVAIEDSRNGVLAAASAGLRCIVVVNDYTRDHDLGGADLVVDSFGSADVPARVLADPHGVGPAAELDHSLLRRLAARERAAAV